MDAPTPFRAPISASNLYRRKFCPGSMNAEEGLPDLPQVPGAIEGTMMHRKEYDPEEDRADLNAAQVRALAKNQRLTETFIQVTFDKLEIEDPGPAKVYKEREFFLCDAKGEDLYPAVPGHTDEIFWYPKVKVCFVLDSKFGRFPVTRAELNYQLRTYFVMVHDDIGPEITYGAIRQPYLSQPDDFHAVEYRAQDAPIARQELLDIIAACHKKDAPRCPSGDACTFCKAKATPRCPESIEFTKQTTRELQRAIVGRLEPQKLELYGPELAMAEKCVKAWQDHMKFVARTYPALLRLYELGKQRWDNRFTDPMAIFQALREKGIFAENEVEALKQFITVCCDPSYAKLRDYVAEKQGVDPMDIEALFFEEFGRRESTDPPEVAGLIEAKAIDRKLQRKK